MYGLIFSNVSVMLVYMLIGFGICKANKAIVSHAKSFSGLLLYVLGPSMIINSFLKMDYSDESFTKMGQFFLVSLAIQLLFFVVLYMILSKKYTDSRYRILTVGSVLGNVGFIGMPLLAGIFPNDPIVLCYSSINVMSMNLIVFTVGVFLITNDKKYMSIKHAILNPTTIAILISIPLFVIDADLPDIVENSVGTLATMVTPMCMIILGMRLSAVKFRVLFCRPFIYITCAIKLIVFPIFAYLCVRWLPFLDDTLKASIVILATTPAGAIIDGLAELHECEQELAANVVLMTTILCVVTIPLVVSILI